jgi:hypothetical protein
MMIHPILSPVTAIIAGVIVLIYPRILNYVVGIYLILSGIIGLGLLSK